MPGQAAPTAPGGGRPYHELLRGPGYRWWQPAAGLMVLAGSFFVLLVLVQAGTVLLDTVRTGGPVAESIDRLSTEFDPLFLAGLNLSLAALLPAVALAVVLIHHTRFGWLSSVAGRLRWAYLARAVWLAIVVAVLFTVAATFLPVDGEAAESPPTVSFQVWLGLAVVVLLTTPLQAAAEEYVFRGYVFQALSAWTRSPWVPMLVTSVVFAFAHGSQNLPLFLDRFAFGLVAGWLVIRTGGLEAAIAMHVVNNVLIFLAAAAFDEVDDALTVSAIPWPLVLLDVLQMVLFAWLATRAFRKHDLSNMTAMPLATARR
jgi:hypothetical protein